MLQQRRITCSTLDEQDRARTISYGSCIRLATRIKGVFRSGFSLAVMTLKSVSSPFGLSSTMHVFCVEHRFEKHGNISL
jgi:hypothetical protein